MKSVPMILLVVLVAALSSTKALKWRSLAARCHFLERTML